MKKGISFILALAAIIGVYTGFIFYLNLRDQSGNSPVIQVPDEILQVSVNDSEETLLQGVTASDEEDGDLTSEVYVENISTFDAEKRRTVTYAVFDSDDHLVRATRQIQYTDYHAPKFNVTKSLYYYYIIVSSDEYKNYVSADSVVDGDISSKISVDKEITENNAHYVTYSVTDSCGTRITIDLKIDQLTQEPNVDINLTNYLLRVSKGTAIDPKDYIESVELFGMPYQLSDEMEIQSNYNPDAAGTYEIIYRISLANGDYGIAKLLIIVEE